MKRILLFATIFSIFNFQFSISRAQTMTVQAPKQVYAGDNFTVRFVVDARASDFRGPSFKGFTLRSGPNTSSSSSYSFVNGQMTSSVQTVYSYTLLADVVGSFTVDFPSRSRRPIRHASSSVSNSSNASSRPTTRGRSHRSRRRRLTRRAFSPVHRSTRPTPIKVSKSSSPTRFTPRCLSASLPSTSCLATVASGRRTSVSDNR